MFFCRKCKKSGDTAHSKCPKCGAFNSYAEGYPSLDNRLGYTEPCPIAKFNPTPHTFYSANTREFDRVLGGGFVPGGIYALTGGPGAGKSTLALQTANDFSIAKFDGKQRKVLYISAEEGTEPVVLRARRLAPDSKVEIFRTREVQRACEIVLKERPVFVVWDSIQKLEHPNLDARAGTASQVMECANDIEAVTQETGCASLVICHLVKDGAMAGPKTFEHLVDCVLLFEQEGSEYRILRSSKNRFAPNEEIGVFQMTREGLRSVENPIALMNPESWSSGNARSLLAVGSRPLLGEIQALARQTMGQPRRTIVGLDRSRVELILAVLEMRCGTGRMDVWLNSAGGFEVKDSGADLGIAMALLSSLTDQVLDDGMAFLGELGLSGELRLPSLVGTRISQAKAMGCTEVIGPIGADEVEGIEYTGLPNLEAVCEYLELDVAVKKPKRAKRKKK